MVSWFPVSTEIGERIHVGSPATLIVRVLTKRNVERQVIWQSFHFHPQKVYIYKGEIAKQMKMGDKSETNSRRQKQQKIRGETLTEALSPHYD